MYLLFAGENGHCYGVSDFNVLLRAMVDGIEGCTGDNCGLNAFNMGEDESEEKTDGTVATIIISLSVGCCVICVAIACLEFGCKKTKIKKTKAT
eukprot:UN02595